jgi:biopolymer transport protein ExbB/TolQ
MIGEILEYWRTGGILMPLLAVLMFAIWYSFFRLRAGIMESLRMPPAFEDELLENLSARSTEQNLATYTLLPGPIPHAVTSALRARRRADEAQLAYDRCRESERERIDRNLVLLTAFTAAAPLLGLLGTVIGMIATFQAVSEQFGNTAVQVSAGISQALVTTQCGLVVAIPGLFGIARVRRLGDQSRARWGECRAHVVCLLTGEGRTA